MRGINTLKQIPLIFLLLFYSGNVDGQQHSDNISLVGQIGGGFVSSIEAKDNYLFVGNGTLLSIYDFINPTNPELIKSIFNLNAINGLYIWNNILFVAAGNELKLYNIDNITSPQNISKIVISETILGSKVLNGILYILLGNKGFKIYDISNIQSPFQLAEWKNVEYTWDIEKIGKYLLVADGTYGVRILEISVRGNLKEVNHLRGNKVTSIELRDNIAYISNLINMLIVDFNLPAYPVIVKEYNTGESPKDIIIEGNYAYIANNTRGLKILEISDPVNPVEVSNSPQANRVLNYIKIKKSLNLVYVIGLANSFNVYAVDISDIYNINEFYTLTCKGIYSLSAFYENYLLVDGLKIVYDISDPANIKEIYRPAVGYTGSISFKDSILFVCASDGIYMWYLNDIFNLEFIKKIPIGDTRLIKFFKNYMITVSFYKNYIFDIRNITEPFLVGTYNYNFGAPKTIEVKDDFAYVGDEVFTIHILDINRPTLPHLIQVINSPYHCKDLEIVGNILYSAEFNGGLRIIDISNPYSPVELKRILYGSEVINLIVREKNFAYLMGNSSLKVLDISNISDPVLAGYYDFYGISFSDIAVKNGLISLTSGTNGIYLLKFDEENYSLVEKVNYTSEFSLSQNYPNPFNPSTTIKYSINKKSNVVIKVYDLIGREVATLVNEEKPAGSYEAEFDGSIVSSGIYLYWLKAGDYNETKKMILLK